MVFYSLQYYSACVSVWVLKKIKGLVVPTELPTGTRSWIWQQTAVLCDCVPFNERFHSVCPESVYITAYQRGAVAPTVISISVDIFRDPVVVYRSLVTMTLAVPTLEVKSMSALFNPSPFSLLWSWGRWRLTYPVVIIKSASKDSKRLE